MQISFICKEDVFATKEKKLGMKTVVNKSIQQQPQAIHTFMKKKKNYN